MTLTAKTLKGTFTAIVTPFTPDGKSVDFDSLGSLLEFQIKSGVQGVVVCGSTGEAATLSESEYHEVVTFTRSAMKGKGTCIAGIGTNDTARACGTARLLEELGVDGILLVGPPYNKPPQRGIAAHFRAVHSVTSLPIIAYNIPGRSVCNILPSTLSDLAADGSIIGVKESTGNMDQVMDLLASTRDKLSILSGEDALVHAMMSCGGAGVISAVANVIPGLFVKITSAALAGRWEDALRAQFEALPIIRTMFAETNPIPVKTALALMGIIKSPALRLPLVAAEATTVEKIRSILPR